MSDEIIEKKRLQENENVQSKKPKVEASIHEKIKKQIEYYLSDENLSRDKFFHTKLSEHPENWMSFKHITSCKKIQDFNVEESVILEAIKDSTEVDIKKTDEEMLIKRRKPLPIFIGKLSKEDQKLEKKLPQSEVSIHNVGYWLKCSNIPEGVTWADIKNNLNNLIKPKLGNVKHVSNIENNVSYIWVKSFENDFEFFSGLKKLQINENEVPIEILNDLETARKAIKNLPKVVDRQRDKCLTKAKFDLLHQPITVGNTNFTSFNHLKRCCREILDNTKVEEFLPESSFEIIKKILEYHPNAEKKLKDLDKIKVGLRNDMNLPKPPKCFFVVRKDGTYEDVSIVKCFDRIRQIIPFPKKL